MDHFRNAAVVLRLMVWLREHVLFVKPPKLFGGRPRLVILQVPNPAIKIARGIKVDPSIIDGIILGHQAHASLRG